MGEDKNSRQARGHGHAHIIQPCIRPRLSQPTFRATIHTRVHMLEQLLLSNAFMPMLISFIIAVFISPIAREKLSDYHPAHHDETAMLGTTSRKRYIPPISCLYMHPIALTGSSVFAYNGWLCAA